MESNNNKELFIENLVIGGSLEAFLYAFINNFSVVFTRKREPSFLDLFEENIIIPDFQLECFEQLIKTNLGEKLVKGIKKESLYKHIAFLLSSQGSIISPENVTSLRVDAEENKIKIFTELTGLHLINYGNLFIFDKHEVSGLEQSDMIETKHTIFDWFKVKHARENVLDLYQFNEDAFVNKIYFLELLSDKAENPFRRVLVVSHILSDYKDDVEYSMAFARLKAQGILREHGVKEIIAECPTHKEQAKFVILKWIARQEHLCDYEFEVEKGYEYDNIHFLKPSADEMVAEINKNKLSPFIRHIMKHFYD